MTVSAAQMAANRANAAKSTGPRTDAGKDAARQNSLKHGLTGAGVVIPGEDEHEVHRRMAALSPKMAPEGDAESLSLVYQYVVASIRHDRAFRHENALIAERMRRADAEFDDKHHLMAEQIFAELPVDPITIRRRLLIAPEGVDLLVNHLRALLRKAEPSAYIAIAWEQPDGEELDRCLGWKPEKGVKSHVALLTQAIAYDLWTGFDPADQPGMTPEERTLWAVGEIHTIITAEIAALEAHRATLDLERFAESREQAAERSILDLGKEGLALRRYAGAAERSMLQIKRELRILRAEARLAAAEPSDIPQIVETMTAQVPGMQDILDELGSFCPPASPLPLPRPKPGVVEFLEDLKSSYVPITVGLAPRRPTPTGP